MSADNWAKCPRCAWQRQDAIDAREAEVSAMYGTVSVDEFDAARAALADQKAAADKAEETFREDYEIYGAEDGEVHVTYSGGCQKCGLRLTFKHTHTLDVDDKGEQA